MKRISIVIALYRSAKTITPVLDELRSVLGTMTDYDYEVVLVNDCSPDNVLEIVEALACHDARVKILDIAKNSGQPNAMMAAFRHVTGNFIVCMDDDFQHDPGVIPGMIAKLENDDQDVVFVRYKKQEESVFRRFGSWLNGYMAEIMAGKPKNIRSNSFFAMRRFVSDAIAVYPHSNPYLFGIIFATTSHIANVDAVHRARARDRSNYTLKSLIGFWFNGFLNFSIKPLRISSVCGLCVSVGALIWAIIMFIERLLHPNVGVAGWTSLIIAIIFFSGIQLIGIGVLGEYLGRLYRSQSHLPTYSIRRKINLEEDTELNDHNKENVHSGQ